MFHVGMPWIKYFKTGEKVFPYPSRYPINMESWGQYLILYFMQLLVGYRVICTFCADSLFAGLVSFICTRMDMLAESLKVSVETNNPRKQTELFKRSVEYHQNIHL